MTKGHAKLSSAISHHIKQWIFTLPKSVFFDLSSKFIYLFYMRKHQIHQFHVVESTFFIQNSNRPYRYKAVFTKTLTCGWTRFDSLEL